MGLIPIEEEPEEYGILEIEQRRARTEKLSPESICRFVEVSEEIRSKSKSRQQVYGCVERSQDQWEYPHQSKAARGRVRRNIEKMTKFSRTQARGWQGSPFLICTTCARASVTVSGA